MLVLALAVALATQSSVAAQPAPNAVASDPDTIVVTGRKAPERAEVQHFVRDVTQRSNQQIARFHAPLCPVVVGLGAVPARVVRERILETAAGVGAQVDPKTNCNANLVVVIADDGSDFVSSLRKHVPDWLQGLSTVQIRQLIKDPAPVRAWSVTSIRNADGLSAQIPEDGESYTMRIMGTSIIAMPTRAQIEGSVIVIDRAAALGASLAQIADYAAMRGLARTRPPASSRVGTILGLFAGGGGEAEPELTRADILYLQSLYASAGTETAIRQRARMAEAIERNGKER